MLPIHNQFIHQKAADLYSTMLMLSGVGQITSHPFSDYYQDIARNYATVCIMQIAFGHSNDMTNLAQGKEPLAKL